MISPLAKQRWVFSATLLSKFGQGMMMGITASLLTALQAPDSPIKLTLASSSWMVATIGIGYLVGHSVSPIVMASFGRRIAFAVMQLPAIAGMLLIFSATDVAYLVCGRLLAGITAGAFPVGAIVVSEYCSPRYRGMFLNMKSSGLYLGSLIVHVIGYQMHWKTLALLSIIPFIITLAITYTWPESPFWLAQRRRFSESEEIFYRLRGTTEDSVREIKELIRCQKDTRIQLKRKYSEQIVELAKKFTKVNFLKPLLIYVFAAILLETSGRHVFSAYSTQILVKITGHGISSHTIYYNLVVDMVLTSSALLSSYLIKIMNMRKLLFSTGLVSCILLVLANSYMYLAAKEIISKDYPEIPISLFGLYFAFVGLGCTPVPLALIGEIFPLEHRAVGVALAGNMTSITLTIMLKITPFMLHNLEVYGTFSVLAVGMALSLLGLYFMLPETKDRTLQEIEEFYIKGRFKNDVEVTCSKDIELKVISEAESLVDK